MIEIVPDYVNGWRLAHENEKDVQVVTTNKTRIEPNTDLNNVKPIGLYENSEDVLRTLEKLYNDYLVRPDECKALDWAMNFIREHRKEGE